MRGRKPRELTLEAGDGPALRQVASRQSLPWFQVRRARTVLAVADGERVEAVADRMQCDRATVWRTCRLYERDGLAGLLSAPARPGRPERLSPPAEGAGRAARLPGAGGQGAAPHPLVQ
jgi:Winged helix-turn helix